MRVSPACSVWMMGVGSGVGVSVGSGVAGIGVAVAVAVGVGVSRVGVGVAVGMKTVAVGLVITAPQPLTASASRTRRKAENREDENFKSLKARRACVHSLDERKGNWLRSPWIIHTLTVCQKEKSSGSGQNPNNFYEVFHKNLTSGDGKHIISQHLSCNFSVFQCILQCQACRWSGFPAGIPRGCGVFFLTRNLFFPRGSTFMRVLLINPRFRLPIDTRTSPHMGLAYLGAVSEERGDEVFIFDADIEEQPLGDFVQEYKPNLVGITSNTPQVKQAWRHAAEIKKVFDVPIVIGGPHPSVVSEDLDYESLDSGNIDIVVRGEGEETWIEISEKVEDFLEIVADRVS